MVRYCFQGKGLWVEIRVEVVPLPWVTANNPSISTRLNHWEITVAMAAPLAPSSGKPSFPKMRTQLKTVFAKAEIRLAYRGRCAFSMHRNNVDRMVAPAMGRNVQAMCVK